MKPPLRSALIVLVAAGFVLIVALATVLLRPYRFHGIEISTPQPAKDFTLTGPGGKPVKLSDFQGKLVVLFWATPTAPTCAQRRWPTSRPGLQKLGEKADKVQVVMVTVDPDRDTPEHLAEYVFLLQPDLRRPQRRP